MADETSLEHAGIPFSAQQPDAHGQAAMLLIESLIHGLIARSVISVTDAVEFVEIAAVVSRDIVEDLGRTDATVERSVILLENISRSLRLDLSR